MWFAWTYMLDFLYLEIKEALPCWALQSDSSAALVLPLGVKVTVEVGDLIRLSGEGNGEGDRVVADRGGAREDVTIFGMKGGIVECPFVVDDVDARD